MDIDRQLHKYKYMIDEKIDMQATDCQIITSKAIEIGRQMARQIDRRINRQIFRQIDLDGQIDRWKIDKPGFGLQRPRPRSTR